jgi:pimeloyl-ACP methyl ester carboxylesterase
LNLAYSIAAVCIAALVAALWFHYLAVRWNARTLVGLRLGSQIAKTRCGEIEYATTLAGPPVLISHGTLGGFDQGMAAAELLLTPQFRPIAVSRPGYLRTPLSAGAAPEQQADAFAALLDSLAIDRVPIIGISGGGPPALQFALRHPQRCTAIVLICAVTQCLKLPRRAVYGIKYPRLASSLFGSWVASLLYAHFPLPIALFAFTPFERQSRSPGINRRDALRLMATSVPVKPRFDGVMNDASYLSTLDALPLERIQQPALIIHGDADKVVPFAHAESAAAKIANARLVKLEHGSHFAAFVRAKEIREVVQDFLNRRNSSK